MAVLLTAPLFMIGSRKVKQYRYEKKLLMCHDNQQLKLLSDFLISVQLLIKEMLIKNLYNLLTLIN